MSEFHGYKCDSCGAISDTAAFQRDWSTASFDVRSGANTRVISNEWRHYCSECFAALAPIKALTKELREHFVRKATAALKDAGETDIPF